jgi:sarcosine oxidase/L-pipecolate oxidase
MNSDDSLTAFDHATHANMTASGYSRTQIVLSNPKDVEKARSDGYGFAINPFGRPEDKNFGLLDTVGGFAYADKACRFALHKARSYGVKTIFGSVSGTFTSFTHSSSSPNRITGVKTADGKVHAAALTILACGGWTPGLLPSLDNLCETTAGSVFIFQLPPESALWEKFALENFPTWTYKVRDGASGGLYGFARDPTGIVKIGYRGTKYTNPQTQPDGKVRSVPITRYTSESLKELPGTAVDVVGKFVDEFLPELRRCEMMSRLCWYTDSYDNHFVIDFVPGTEGLMVATGGSGHGFKFLPNLGKYVVDRIEGDKSGLLKLWQWREKGSGEVPYNVIGEGEQSQTVLSKQKMCKEDSLSSKESKL